MSKYHLELRVTVGLVVRGFGDGDNEAAAADQLFEDLQERLNELPGVTYDELLKVERHARKANVYAIPAGAKASRCRSCDAPIFWGKTDAGKAIPLDLGGTSHFLTCPHAAKWSKTP